MAETTAGLSILALEATLNHNLILSEMLLVFGRLSFKRNSTQTAVTKKNFRNNKLTVTSEDVC